MAGKPHVMYHTIFHHHSCGVYQQLPESVPDQEVDTPVRGGILADEMGMGKTVELLACLLAHPFSGPRIPDELVRTLCRLMTMHGDVFGHLSQHHLPPTAGLCLQPHQLHAADRGELAAFEVRMRLLHARKIGLPRHGRPACAMPVQAKAAPRARGERIECVCGLKEQPRYGKQHVQGTLWIQCDTCEAWLHGVCVGHPRQAPKGLQPACLSGASLPAAAVELQLHVSALAAAHMIPLYSKTAEAVRPCRNSCLVLSKYTSSGDAFKRLVCQTRGLKCMREACTLFSHLNCCLRHQPPFMQTDAAAHCAPAGEYVCRRCMRHAAGTQVTADCGATLIVCPDAILPQWKAEIERHTHAGAAHIEWCLCPAFCSQSSRLLNILPVL